MQKKGNNDYEKEMEETETEEEIGRPDKTSSYVPRQTSRVLKQKIGGSSLPYLATPSLLLRDHLLRWR